MDVLKIFVSTLVVLLITAIVFFGMYFLFPDLSDSVFGVSYAHGCTIDGLVEREAFSATMDDMKAGLQETVKDAAEGVSAAAGNAVEKVKDAIPSASEEVRDADPQEILDASVEKVREAVSSVDSVELGQKLSKAEEDVVEFFSSGKGKRFLDELKKEDAIPDDFDISKASGSEEGRKLIGSISDFVRESGIELGDVLSNANLHRMISGKADETIDALKGIFENGGRK